MHRRAAGMRTTPPSTKRALSEQRRADARGRGLRDRACRRCQPADAPRRPRRFGRAREGTGIGTRSRRATAPAAIGTSARPRVCAPARVTWRQGRRQPHEGRQRALAAQPRTVPPMTVIGPPRRSPRYSMSNDAVFCAARRRGGTRTPRGRVLARVPRLALGRAEGAKPARAAARAVSVGGSARTAAAARAPSACTRRRRRASRTRRRRRRPSASPVGVARRRRTPPRTCRAARTRRKPPR